MYRGLTVTATPSPTPVPRATIYRVLTVRELRALCQRQPSALDRVVVKGYALDVFTTFGWYGAIFDHQVSIPLRHGPGVDFGPGVVKHHGIYVIATHGTNAFPVQGNVVVYGVVTCEDAPFGYGLPWIRLEYWHPSPAPTATPMPTPLPVTPTPCADDRFSPCPPVGTATPTPVPTAKPVKTAVGGVTFSLEVPLSAYSKDALVPVELHIRNGSGRPVLLPRIQCDTVLLNPRADVVARNGWLLYPFSHAQLGGRCGARNAHILARGRSITIDRLVILQSDRVVGVASLVLLTRGHGRPTHWTLETRELRVRVLPKLGLPQIKLVAAPRVHLDLTGLRKQRDVDLLFYMDRWQCGKRIGGHSFWAPTDQAQLEPGCPHPLEWSVVVGRPGSPVIWVDY